MSNGAFTAAFHMGSQVCQEHNRRDPAVMAKEKHIDPKKVHETWIDIPLKQAYAQFFGDALKRYNDRQKREDRKIDDYLQHVKRLDKGKNSMHPAYECILTLGNINNRPPEDLARQCYREFVSWMQQRFSHLRVIGAYYHADERGAAHCHVSIVPVADGCKRGLDTQPSFSAALELDGLHSRSKKDHNRIDFCSICREQLRTIAIQHGLDMNDCKQEERQHEDTETYIRRKKSEELQESLKKLEGRIVQESELQAEIAGKTLLGKPRKKVKIDYEEYKKLQCTARSQQSREEYCEEKVRWAEKAMERAEAAEQLAIKREREANNMQHYLDKQIDKVELEREELQKCMEKIRPREISQGYELSR